jgi:hypothetical protein
VIFLKTSIVIFDKRETSIEDLFYPSGYHTFDPKPRKELSIGCSFKCIFKVGIEESIVNASLIRLQSKNTNNAKSEVGFKQPICNPWCVHNRLFNAKFEEKFK